MHNAHTHFFPQKCGQKCAYCTWQNMVLKNGWVNNEIKEKIKRQLETNEIDHTIAQNLWETIKTVVKGEFIAIQAYFKKTEES